jgi:hypothetical protein
MLGIFICKELSKKACMNIWFDKKDDKCHSLMILKLRHTKEW